MRLQASSRAWEEGRFAAALKEELEATSPDALHLERALNAGNYLLDDPPTVLVNGFEERDGVIAARIGVFFGVVDAGDCCIDDPAPQTPHEEYCELELRIAKEDGETRVRLLD